MKYESIDSKLFIKNRSNFASKMINNSLAVFNSNDIYPVSADSTLPFAQHRDIFYLSGVDQEESILVLFPVDSNPEHREILFLKETNDHIAVWEGAKLNKDQALESTGVKTVYWLQDFEKIFFSLMQHADGVYHNTNEHYRASVETQTRGDRYVIWCKEKYPAHKIHRSQPILQRLRSVKDQIEIDLMQKACNITNKGFRRVLDFVKPGVMEYEIEAELSHEFLRNRSKGFAYTPIIGSGYNACVLHYIENNQECKDGDMILLDVAAEYANYSSDMTRTIPVSGKFTQRQKDVYNAVLRVKTAAAKLLVPGTIWADFHVEVGELMTVELIGLGLLSQEDVDKQDPKWPAYKKYFMHGTAHHIGLDTHDYGILTEPMQANMVFTVEPGIYIPEENLGIRIEDNYVIQEKGVPINMMGNIPETVEDIERLMAK